MSESTTTTTQEERQLDREAQSLEAGMAQYRNSLKIQGTADSVIGQRIIRQTIDPLIEVIKHELRTRRGRRSGVDHLIADIDPMVLALLTCRVAMQGITEDRQKSAVAITLGNLLVEHLNWVALRKESKGLSTVIERQVKETGHERHRRAVCNHVTKQYLTERVEWTPKQVASVGLKLVELCVASTGLIELQTRIRRKRGKYMSLQYVTATEATLKMLEDGHTRMELTKPIYTPMVVKPRPWTNASDGGYLSRRNLLVKSKNPLLVDELMSVDLSPVLSALNALQDTAYRINPGILEVLTKARENGDQLPQLVSPEPLPRPAKPHDIATNDVARKEWKTKVAKIETQNRALASERIATYTMHTLAEDLSNEEAIYFPHTLDWRGRAYPLPGTLQPQGSDLAKALLHYSEAKPITETGANWLKIHIANLFGEDKVSLDDRIKWTEENAELLIESALDPLDCHFWQDADKPWQALAACFEFTGYMMSGESPDYLSRLPIAVDGSCNGLQNLSAMLRDPAGGAATNLVPADKPQDIYTMVAERAMERVGALPHVHVSVDETVARILKYKEEYKEDKAAPRDDLDAMLAGAWLKAGISRKLAKRPVMTKPYGVSAYGMKDQIQGQLMEEGTLGNNKEYIYAMAKYLAPIINDAINEIVVASRDVMDWLQSIAKIAAGAGFPLFWTTPLGLPVVQDYRKMKGKSVQIRVGGIKKFMALKESTSEINTRRQAQGCSPNVIHSLDASHMMHTINCASEGSSINSFTMVHDSFATHAADIQNLNEWLRYAFVDMYSVDILADLRDQFVKQLPPEVVSELPPAPVKGDLDLDLVKDSLYFFA